MSTSFYPLLHPASAPAPVLDGDRARRAPNGDSSVFVSGIDPGWALDILPILVSGVSAGIEEIRVQEIFNYALYDQPDVVREVIGFGGPMDETPLMLLDFSLEMVWAPMVRVLADAARRRARRRATSTSSAGRWSARSRSPGMGTFEAGHAGRVPLRGRRASSTAGRCWSSSTSPASTTTARPTGRRRRSPAASHRVRITGHPNLDVTIHGTEPGEPGAAGGGNATAANRIVNAIPAVCAAPAGPVSPLDLPPITGARQLRRR